MTSSCPTPHKFNTGARPSYGSSSHIQPFNSRSFSLLNEKLPMLLSTNDTRRFTFPHHEARYTTAVSPYCLAQETKCRGARPVYYSRLPLGTDRNDWGAHLRFRFPQVLRLPYSV